LAESRRTAEKVRGLTFEQASALLSAEGADITIAGSPASLTTFRYIDAYELGGKVLVVVLAAKPVRWGIGAGHIEQGLVFSSDNSVRAATEIELQNSRVGVQVTDFERAETWQVWLVAAVCAAFSLPWFYILTVSIYTMVRDSDPPTLEVIYVLAAVAAAASFFSYFAYRLANGRHKRKTLLSTGFLWCWAVVSMLLAAFSLTARPPLMHAAFHFGGLALGAGLLALARRTKLGKGDG
jgi:hypothetical protein